MQITAGGVALSSELFSSNGVLRGTDVMVNNDNVFAYYQANAGGGVGTPCIQVWNPAGSGKTIFIDEVIITASDIGIAQWGFTSTQFASAPNQWISMKNGLTLGSGQVDTFDGTPAATSYVGAAYLAANGNFIVPLPFPMMISPGKGVVVRWSSTTTAFQVAFSGREFTN